MNGKSMPDIIYAGLMHERISDEYSLRCDKEKIGINDTQYTRTQAIVELLEDMKREDLHVSCGDTAYNQALDNAIQAIKDMK